MPRKPQEFDNHPLVLNNLMPEYRGVCKHVVDGDTVDVFIDLGLNQYAYETLRLFGVNTPDIYRPKDDDEKQAGFAAKSRVEELILNKPVKIVTYKDKSSFGRYVAEIYFPINESDPPEEWISLAAVLIYEGHAEEI